MPIAGSRPQGSRKVKLAYLVSHPIQYQAPLLRLIARDPGIDLTVFFGSDFSLRAYADQGFGGIQVRWDVPLVAGYKHEFLPTLRNGPATSPTTVINHGIFSRLRGRGGERAFDLLWVHGYSTVNALFGILAANALGIPVLLRSDSTLVDRPRRTATLICKRIFFRALRHFIAGVLPTGTLNRIYWRQYFGPDFPAWTMPYAVDNAFFQERSKAARDSRGALQAELNLDPTRPVILFASKLQERKRCIDLLEAYFKLAPAAGLDPHPYLLIVGDGEERPALESRARQSGVTSIRFCGFRNQSELPRFFDLATVFVLPSRHEPWGLIINEVMNAGRPVIVSSDVGCHPDLVTDGVEGFVFPVGNVQALTHALHRILEVEGAASRMGERAFERIAQWSFDEDLTALRNAVSVLAP